LTGLDIRDDVWMLIRQEAPLQRCCVLRMEQAEWLSQNRWRSQWVVALLPH
jgi:hypothetical protein